MKQLKISTEHKLSVKPLEKFVRLLISDHLSGLDGPEAAFIHQCARHRNTAARIFPFNK